MKFLAIFGKNLDKIKKAVYNGFENYFSKQERPFSIFTNEERYLP